MRFEAHRQMRIAFRLTVLVLGVLIARPCASAAPQMFPFDLPWGETVAPTAVADIDLDGDLDGVTLGKPSVVGEETLTTLVLNDGLGSATAWTTAWTGPVERTVAVALGDIDGDGYPDLVSANYTGGSTLYLNDHGMFGSSPAWRGTDTLTTSLVLGDVDGDGDLDLLLVPGASPLGPRPLTLYLNEGGTFSSAPKKIGPARMLYSVALGDVDGDGDLDLLISDSNASIEGSSDLYLNDGGVFSSAPAWTGPSGVGGIAFADIDSDGDLDLVLSGDGGTRLFLNQGGALATSAAWTVTSESSHLAVGDLDGDGKVDLMFYDWQAQRCVIYLNENGTFSSTPEWSPTNGAADLLADMNGDGKLDAISGGICLNRSSFFSSTPAWKAPPDVGNDVVLGDVDNDGRIDLVAADLMKPDRSPGGAMLFRNTGDMLAPTPVWIGPPEYTTRLALSDVNNDGKLDLVSGNARWNNDVSPTLTLHLNEDGVFATNPAWTDSGDFNEIDGLALADLNGDGLPDLVESGTLSRVYLNRGGIFSHTWTELPVGGTGRFALSDVDLDGAPDLLCYDGAGPSLHLNKGGGFSATPAWRAQVDGGNFYYALGDIDGDGYPDLVTDYWSGSSLFLNRGGTFARLPIWSDSQPMQSFEATLADVDGDGDLDLVVDGQRILFNEGGTFSSQAVTSDSAVVSGVTLGDINGDGHMDLIQRSYPWSSRGLELHLAKTAWVSAGAPYLQNVRVTRVDNDHYHVVFETVDRESSPVWVVGQYEFEGSADWHPMKLDNVSLHTGPWTASPDGVAHEMAWDVSGIGADPRHVIVRFRVVPFSGVAQYIASYNLDVGPLNVAASSLALADAHGDFPSSADTRVTVSLPAWARFQEGALFYRAGGAARYDSTTLTMTEVVPGSFAPAGIIPASAVGARGVEYWVGVRTLTGAVTDPRENAAGHSHFLRTKVTDLAENEEHAGNHYHMVSVPLDLDLGSTSSLAAIVSDEAAFGPPDRTRWRAFRYSPRDSGYLEVGADSSAEGELQPQPGRAFWIISRDPNRIDTAPVPGHSVPTDSAYGVTLQPGWNQVGDPFDFPVAWSEVTWPGMPDGVEPPVGWNEEKQQYESGDVAVLEPFSGYWVKNTTTHVIVLRVAPRDAASFTLSARQEAQDRLASPESWSVQITASSGAACDARNFAGVAPSAREGADPFDRSDPPPAPGSEISLYFLSTSSEAGAPLRRTVDIRSPIGPSGAGGQQWIFDVALTGGKPQPQDVTLAFKDLDRVPSELEVRLIDRVLEKTIDLREQNSYSLVATTGANGHTSADARFELLIGTPEWLKSRHTGSTDLPPATRLMANRPNPFSSGTVIRFETARPGNVAITVFDVAGRLVRKLTDDKEAAGLHEILWRGDDNDGRRVPSGVYIVRFVTPGTTATRKLVRVGSR